MKLTRKLALALCLAFSFITLSSNSQTIDYTTGNLTNYSTSPSSTTSIWNNGVYVNSLQCWAGGDPGYCGPNPSVRPGGYINFSYGLTDLNQTVNVATSATAAAGGTAGVNVTGFRFSFTAKNGNGWDDGRVDQLSAYVKLYNSTNTATLENYNYNLTQKFNWTNFNYNETFTTPRAVSTVGNAQYGFIGRDNNFWAGPYGPEVFNVNFQLKFSTNPCATNPAYSSTCAGFNTVLTSNNLVPNPTGYASWGGSINNSFAIQTALQHSGTGMTVHGFNYGYNVNAAQSYCALEIIWCFDWRQGGSAQVNVGITNASGQNLYSVNRQYNESGYSSNNFQYRFPSSLNQLALGSFNFTASTSGDATVSGMYANMVYSQDPCFFNPNYSPQCTNKPTTTSTYTAPTNDQTFGTTSLNVGGVQLSTDGTISAPTSLPPPPPGSTPPPGSEPLPGSTSVASTAPPGSTPPGATSSPSPGAGPSATASAGPAQRQESGGKSSGGNLSLAMSVVSRVQAADRATQNAAVANAQQVVATSSAAAQAQANQVVEQANTLSAESSQASQTITASTMQQGSMQQQGGTATQGSLQGPATTSIQTISSLAQQSSATATTQYSVQAGTQVNETVQVQSQGLQGLPLQQPQQPQVTQPTMPVYQPPIVATNESSSIYSLTAGTTIRPLQGINLNSQANTVSIAMITPQMMQQRQEFKFDSRTEQEQPQTFQQPQTAMTRGSILNDIIEQRVNVASFQMEQQMDSVKKNVLPNELAGGVDIAAMAMTPKGYETYSIVTLRDVPFYKPEAIYKDNKTVDNARVLRGLTGGSDAKHQEMVNQQYKLGN